MMNELPIYRLIHRDTNAVTRFQGADAPRKIAAFMLGRRIGAFMLIKSDDQGYPDTQGDRVVPMDGDVAVIEQNCIAA